MWTGPPPPQQWAAGPPQHAQQWGMPKKDDWNAWGEPHRPADPRLDVHRASDPRQQPVDPRHDLRGGISGRLNGDMWSQHQHAAGPNKLMPTAAVNQWGAQVSLSLQERMRKYYVRSLIRLLCNIMEFLIITGP